MIPNEIVVEKWKQIDKSLARQLPQLPSDLTLLLFVAMEGGQDSRKGYDLFLQASQQVTKSIPEPQLIVIGQLPPENPPDLGAPIKLLSCLRKTVSSKTERFFLTLMGTSKKRDLKYSLASIVGTCQASGHQ